MEEQAVFVWVARATADVLDRFKRDVVGGTACAQSDFGYPAYAAEAEVQFETEAELIAFLLSRENAEYSIYWTSTTRKVSAHFLADGSIVFTRVIEPAERASLELIQALADVVSAELGFVGSDLSPPPSSKAELIAEWRRAGARWRRDGSGLIPEAGEVET